MAKKIYLVCEASKEEYKKAATKNHAKNKQMDCWTQTTNIYACTTKKDAIKDCREYNKKSTWDVYYIQEINLYKKIR